MEENKKPNLCIACTVKECAHHARTSNYCSLDKISVVTHEANPTMTECTDCESFRLESNSGCTTCGETGAR